MATKPASLPEWASGGGAVITEPTSGEKQDGAVSGEFARAEHINWALNLIYLWLAYLDDLAAQAFAWTGLHTFTRNHATESTVTITNGGAGKALNVVGTTETTLLGVTGTATVGGTASLPGGIINHPTPGYTAPTLAAGWANDSGGSFDSPAGYYKTIEGEVQLKGRVATASLVGNTVFTLPVGFRPAHPRVFVTAATNTLPGATVNVDVRNAFVLDTGEVQLSGSAATAFAANLDNIRFKV